MGENHGQETGRRAIGRKEGSMKMIFYNLRSILTFGNLSKGKGTYHIINFHTTA
jgi:hypothetical protein